MAKHVGNHRIHGQTKIFELFRSRRHFGVNYRTLNPSLVAVKSFTFQQSEQHFQTFWLEVEVLCCLPCLVPMPHFSARPKLFGSRGPCENVRPETALWGWQTRPEFRISKLKIPLKQTDGKGNFKRMLSFLQVDKGRLFFIKLSFQEFKMHGIFITANRSAWPVLNSKRHQAAKFLKYFQVHFVLYSHENYVFVNILS